MATKLPPLGGFSIAPELFNWLKDNLPEWSVILELGSGNGTAHLAERWRVFSVEHDDKFVDRFDSTYIHAPIVEGWYDSTILSQELPENYDLILVDGPPGTIGRKGFLEHLDLFRHDVPIIFDDTHREPELRLAERVRDRLARSSVTKPCRDGRKFTVLPV